MGPEPDALGPYELERGDIGQHSLDVAAHRLDEAQKGLQRREQGSDAVIDGSRAAPCCNLLSTAADPSNAQSGTDLIFDLREDVDHALHECQQIRAHLFKLGSKGRFQRSEVLRGYIFLGFTEICLLCLTQRSLLIVVRVDFGGIDIVERHLGTLYTACTGLTGELGASLSIILIPKGRVVLTGILELFGESDTRTSGRFLESIQYYVNLFLFLYHQIMHRQNHF